MGTTTIQEKTMDVYPETGQAPEGRTEYVERQESRSRPRPCTIYESPTNRLCDP